MSVTQKEIAEKLGVSISLVSRVLADKTHEISVPEETIKRVQEVAEEMGYQPNVAAQALKGISPRMIGVVVYDFNDPFFTDFIGHLQEQFHNKGYSTVLVGFSDRQINERDLSPLKQHTLDAIVVLGSDTERLIFEQQDKTPIFRIGHGHPDEKTIRYCSNEELAATTLADHLRSNNCMNVLLVQNATPMQQLRIDLIEQALAEVSIHTTSEVLMNHVPFDAAYSFAMNLLKHNDLPDAIVCATDLLALGIIKGLLSCRVCIPEQVRITGFDDIRPAHQSYPGLTTFSQPMDLVIEKIIQRIENNDFDIGVEQVECPLIVRDSG